MRENGRALRHMALRHLGGHMTAGDAHDGLNDRKEENLAEATPRSFEPKPSSW